MRRIRTYSIASIGIIIVLAASIYYPKKIENSWPFQARQLKVFSILISKFRNQHARAWPSEWNDLATIAFDVDNPSYIRALYFAHPDTGVKQPWLVFDPYSLPKIHDSERIIAAAPTIGGYLPEQANQRLVMFESGSVTWIVNELFLIGTRKMNPQANQ